jgi:hypothetical protein
VQKGGPVGPGSHSQRLQRPNSVKTQVRATNLGSFFRTTWPEAAECGEPVPTLGGDAAPRPGETAGLEEDTGTHSKEDSDTLSAATMRVGTGHSLGYLQHDDCGRRPGAPTIGTVTARRASRERDLHQPESILASDVVRPQGTTEWKVGEGTRQWAAAAGGRTPALNRSRFGQCSELRLRVNPASAPSAC